jgi:hypothetical protein
MKFNKTFAALVAVLALVFAGNALAAKKYYVGVEKTEWDVVLQNNVARVDNEIDGKQIHFGYQASENFSIELVYGANDDLDDDETYYGVLLRPQTQLFSIVKASVIMGLVRGPLFEESDGFSWGFGAEFTPSKIFSLTADWIHYADEDDQATGISGRISGLNLGVRLRFGGGED